MLGKPFHRPGWIYEEKYDGWRMLAFKDGPRVRLISRRLLLSAISVVKQAPDDRRFSMNLRGGRSRDRTCDLSLVRAALSQLSYPPVFEESRTSATLLSVAGADVPRTCP